MEGQSATFILSGAGHATWGGGRKTAGQRYWRVAFARAGRWGGTIGGLDGKRSHARRAFSLQCPKRREIFRDEAVMNLTCRERNGAALASDAIASLPS